MSLRATRRGLGWIMDLGGQVAALAAVPAAILLALALKPQPVTEKRTEPLWHNVSHLRACPACRLLSRQANNAPPVLPELTSQRVTPATGRAELPVPAGTQPTMEAVLTVDSPFTTL